MSQTSAEQAMRYPVKESTHFDVSIEAMDLQAYKVRTRWIRGCPTIRDAQERYIAMRDASGLGASQFSSGHLFDEEGRKIASISFTGAVWPPVGEGAAPWPSDVRPFAPAPEPEREPVAEQDPYEYLSPM